MPVLLATVSDIPPTTTPPTRTSSTDGRDSGAPPSGSAGQAATPGGRPDPPAGAASTSAPPPDGAGTAAAQGHDSGAGARVPARSASTGAAVDGATPTDATPSVPGPAAAPAGSPGTGGGSSPRGLPPTSTCAAAVLPASQTCSATMASSTGSSGNAGSSARGGSSGSATSTLTLSTGVDAAAARAVSGPGGSATANAVSGASGRASASASCFTELRLVDVVVHGDVTLLCVAVAVSTSGDSGSSQARAVGGSSGDASAAPMNGAVLSAATGVSGAGGAAVAAATTGATGDSSAVAGCDYVIALTRVRIDGQLRLLCTLFATAASGSSGVGSAIAAGGSSGSVTVDGAAVSADGGPAGAGGAQSESGAVGAALADVICGRHLDLVDVMLGGLVDSCTSAVVMAPGTPGLARTSSSLGAAGAVAMASSTSGRALPSTTPAPLVAATSGHGGQATAVAWSGTSGDALSSALCVLVLDYVGLEVAGDLQWTCQPTASAVSGATGDVIAAAVGGSSGAATSSVRPPAEPPAPPTRTGEPAPGPAVRAVELVRAAPAARVETPGAPLSQTRLWRQSAAVALPATGGDIGRLALSGAAALLTGLALLGASRRRAPGST
jgi:hypothetical protein